MIPFSFQYIIAGTKTEEASSSETQRREGGGKEKRTEIFVYKPLSHSLVHYFSWQSLTSKFCDFSDLILTNL